jgi:hypothetical protein
MRLRRTQQHKHYVQTVSRSRVRVALHLRFFKTLVLDKLIYRGTIRTDLFREGASIPMHAYTVPYVDALLVVALASHSKKRVKIVFWQRSAELHAHYCTQHLLAQLRAQAGQEHTTLQ